uniref:Midasin n=1 Tax=Lygus hesperus TaxID=30085 RepID=A0A146L4X1_LYGHE
MKLSTVEVLLLAAFITLASGAHIKRRAVTEDVGMKSGGGGGGGGGGFGGGQDGSGAGFGAGYGGNDDEEAGNFEDGQICENCNDEGGEGIEEEGGDEDESSDDGGKDDDMEAGGDDSCGSVLCVDLRKNELEKRNLRSSMKIPDLANEQPPIWFPNSKSQPKHYYYSSYSYLDGGHGDGIGEIEQAIGRPIQDISNIVTVIPWVFANNRGIQMKITPIYPEPIHSLVKTLMGSPLARFKRDEGTDEESSNDEQEESEENEEESETGEEEAQAEVREGEEEAGEGEDEGEIGGEEVGETPIEMTELFENESPNEEGLAEESLGEEENEEGIGREDEEEIGEEGGENEEVGDTDEEMTEEGENLMREAEDEELEDQAEVQEEEEAIEEGEIDGEAGDEPINTGVEMEMLSAGSDGDYTNDP